MIGEYANKSKTKAANFDLMAIEEAMDKKEPQYINPNSTNKPNGPSTTFNKALQTKDMIGGCQSEKMKLDA
jgi:hypothetical protein